MRWITPESIETVRAGIAESSEFLDILATDVHIAAPPRIDDFDSAERITWRAIIGACQYVGGRLLFHTLEEPPTKKTLLKLARRDASFSLLIAIHPARRFILEALQVFGLSPKDLLASVIAHRALVKLELIEYDLPLPTAAEAIDDVLSEVISSAKELTEKGRRAIAYDRREDERGRVVSTA